MPRNLELKAQISSVADAEGTARRCGARFVGLLVQVDTYFFVASGRLKLRVIAGEGGELIFYHRSEDGSDRWSDYRKIPLQDPAAHLSILADALGIRATVRKKRMLFLYKGCRIHLDDVEGLGAFIEFEVPDPGEGEPLELMAELREAFSIRPDAVIPGSYADLILAEKRVP